MFHKKNSKPLDSKYVTKIYLVKNYLKYFIWFFRVNEAYKKKVLYFQLSKD